MLQTVWIISGAGARCSQTLDGISGVCGYMKLLISSSTFNFGIFQPLDIPNSPKKHPSPLKLATISAILSFSSRFVYFSIGRYRSFCSLDVLLLFFSFVFPVFPLASRKSRNPILIKPGDRWGLFRQTSATFRRAEKKNTFFRLWTKARSTCLIFKNFRGLFVAENFINCVKTAAKIIKFLLE